MKTVRIKVSFELDREVPEDWDDDMVLFFYNDSSHCSRNEINDLLEKCGSCTCMETKAELVSDLRKKEQRLRYLKHLARGYEGRADDCGRLADLILSVDG